MAMTTTDTRQNDTTTQALPLEPTTGLGGLFVWVAVAVALVAATVLAARVFGADDSAAPQPWYSVEHGSIAANDHAAEVRADQPFSVEHGSVAAIDHAASAAAGPADVSAEHGSITALDHAAESAGSPADVSAEHGSITALDHAADDDETETG
jgi:hypothetical protein